MGMMLPVQLHPFSASDVSSVTARREERMRQWGHLETKDFIAIRAELEKEFSHATRNKTLWKVIVNKMKEKGYRRSADQCKCKWKNLMNCYKMAVTSQGKQTSEPDNGRQCPFFEELHTILTERARTMDKCQLKSGPMTKKRSRKGLHLSDQGQDSQELQEGKEDLDESDDERAANVKKKITDKERQRKTAERIRANRMQEVLECFFEQQKRMEVQWREGMRRKEEERRAREQDFRNAMQSLENERMVREQQCRDIEEQRQAREEAFAEKRDALFNVILNRLAREGLKHVLSIGPSILKPPIKPWAA